MVTAGGVPDPVLTGLVVVVDSDHGRFQVPDWELLLQGHVVDLGLVLLQLKREAAVGGGSVRVGLRRGDSHPVQVDVEVSVLQVHALHRAVVLQLQRHTSVSVAQRRRRR